MQVNLIELLDEKFESDFEFFNLEFFLMEKKKPSLNFFYFSDDFYNLSPQIIKGLFFNNFFTKLSKNKNSFEDYKKIEKKVFSFLSSYYELSFNSMESLDNFYDDNFLKNFAFETKRDLNELDYDVSLHNKNLETRNTLLKFYNSHYHIYNNFLSCEFNSFYVPEIKEVVLSSQDVFFNKDFSVEKMNDYLKEIYCGEVVF